MAATNGNRPAMDKADDAAIQTSRPTRPAASTRKTSFGDAVNKFTDRTHLFGHRRRMTTAALSNSTSLASVSTHESLPSRLPTPSGLMRSDSFLGGLNIHIHPSNDENSNPVTPPAVREHRHRRISDKLTQLPFFTHENQAPNSQLPVSTRDKRNSSVNIQHRGLMAPIQPATLPRNSTICNIAGSCADTKIPAVKLSTYDETHQRRQSGSNYHGRTCLVSRTPLNGVPLSSTFTSHKPVTKSSASDIRRPPSTPLSICFSPKKANLALCTSPSIHALAPVAKTFNASQGGMAKGSQTFPCSAHMPSATGLPTPPIALLTPEYDVIDEDLRDKRAAYINLKSPRDDDGNTDINFLVQVEHVERMEQINGQGGVVDETHRKASNHEEQDLGNGLKDKAACDGDPELDARSGQADPRDARFVSKSSMVLNGPSKVYL